MTIAQFGEFMQWVWRFMLIKHAIMGFQMTFADMMIWTLFAVIVIPALFHFFE